MAALHRGWRLTADLASRICDSRVLGLFVGQLWAPRGCNETRAERLDETWDETSALLGMLRATAPIRSGHARRRAGKGTPPLSASP